MHSYRNVKMKQPEKVFRKTIKELEKYLGKRHLKLINLKQINLKCILLRSEERRVVERV